MHTKTHTHKIQPRDSDMIVDSGRTREEILEEIFPFEQGGQLGSTFGFKTSIDSKQQLNNAKTTQVLKNSISNRRKISRQHSTVQRVEQVVFSFYLSQA